MTNQWLPDYVSDDTDGLTADAGIYLDGALQESCFEFRVKWESFDKPTFGELIIAVERDCHKCISPLTHRPGLGEFAYKGKVPLVRFVCGQVYIEMKPEKRAILNKLRELEERRGK